MVSGYIEPAIGRIMPNHVKRFRRKIRELNRLIKEIREYEPEANLYMNEDHMEILVGPSHVERGYQCPIGGDMKHAPENVAVTEYMEFAGCGAQ